MEQHGGISEKRQELFGKVLTSLNKSSQPFLCLTHPQPCPRGAHTKLVLMRCTKGYQARVRVMIIFGETVLIYPKLLQFIHLFS